MTGQSSYNKLMTLSRKSSEDLNKQDIAEKAEFEEDIDDQVVIGDLDED